MIDTDIVLVAQPRFYPRISVYSFDFLMAFQELLFFIADLLSVLEKKGELNSHLPHTLQTDKIYHHSHICFAELYAKYANFEKTDHSLDWER